MNKPKIKVYVTKYALTSGVKFVEVEERPGEECVWTGWSILGKGHYASTLEEAKVQIEAMRIKKIASLKKQIARLEKMMFAIPEESGNG